MSLPVLAVVGRPNVGKSTFFNRVLGQRVAIVEDRPGVTRDRNFARAEWNGRPFWLVDTGGMVENSDEPMDRLIRRQVLTAIDEADAVVLMVDGKAGPHPLDFAVADHLRRADKPALVIVNKVDNLGAPNALAHHEFWSLGLGEPQPVSSTSGKGSGDVLDAMVNLLPSADPAEDPEALRIAVVGRPNVGKSSLINRLLGEERLVVSDVAGTTRDSIDTAMRFHGRDVVFIDTAGLRRQSKVDESVEYFSGLRTERAIERADVCVLLVDATETLAQQDLRIANMAWDAGCGLVLLVNKWDLVPKETMTSVNWERAAIEKAPFLEWVPKLFISATTGQRVQKILDTVLEVAEERQRRIPTHEVNETLRELVSRSRPPHHGGHAVKILYATQVAVAPPTIVLWSNDPDGIPPTYERYLQNGFRARWGFIGVPLRLRWRARDRAEDE